MLRAYVISPEWRSVSYQRRAKGEVDSVGRQRRGEEERNKENQCHHNGRDIKA